MNLTEERWKFIADCAEEFNKFPVWKKVEAGGDISRFLSDDLLNKRYKGEKLEDDSVFFGHCYVACEAIYHLYAREGGYKPFVLKIGNLTHWFLKNGSGEILDPTVLQFCILPEYNLGKGCGFLTREPSKRARVLMERIRNGRS